ncbi:MAG: hypothetical protein N3E42_01340 [Candidatus Bipolaricaulota bacterium]|nr:hypothetical protein [Candidatus Bipolaricaulota bacterium]
MAQELILEYDREGDILEASSTVHGPIIAKDIGDDIWLKVDEQTGAIAGFLILNFIKRQRPITLPFSLIAPGTVTLGKAS